MKNLKFYRCSHCGNIVIKLVDSKVPIICCGEIMQELAPNTVDAAQEKHVPVVSIENQSVKVSVGSVAHPMLEEHYINFIALETESGWQVKYLSPNTLPEATFNLNDDKAVAVYEYCNLHGLWKTSI